MSSEPVISVGEPTVTQILPGTGWTKIPTGLLVPCDGRTHIEGQMAVSLPWPVSSRPFFCEVQTVRDRPGFPENPTMQDDHQFTFKVVNGVIRINQRQNWIYGGEMRTYADEPLRFEARHPGSVAINLEWVFKLVLIRAEGGRE